MPSPQDVKATLELVIESLGGAYVVLTLIGKFGPPNSRWVKFARKYAADLREARMELQQVETEITVTKTEMHEATGGAPAGTTRTTAAVKSTVVGPAPETPPAPTATPAVTIEHPPEAK